MITLNVFYKAKPGMAKAFIDAVNAEGLRDCCLKEDGCAQYDYFISLDDGDMILLVEQWADKAAQEHHCSTPHMQRLRELKKEYIDDTQIKEYP